MAKIWVMQHHPVENLGSIADALEGAALAWQYVRTFEGQPVPKDMKGAGGLILMGGPQGVYEADEHPYLKEEMRLIESALKDDRPVLGVCLGSQLLAAALGAKVYKGTRREIGWHPVKLTADARDDRLLKGVPEQFTAFHWHGDIFDLPKDSVTLASSEITPDTGVPLSRQGLRISLPPRGHRGLDSRDGARVHRRGEARESARGHPRRDR